MGRHHLIIGLFASLIACRAADEAATLPHFPYPDGGLADAQRRVVDSALDGLAPLDVLAPLDANPRDQASEAADAPLSSDGGATCPVSCDDDNPCTVDSCDPRTGLCVNVMASEGSACDNACLTGGTGSCRLGVCTGGAVADGTSCDDRNPCTVADACKDGLCFSGRDMACPAVDACHEPGHCERATGTCTTPESANGKACDDQLTCTTGDQCGQGVCAGVALACRAGAACAEDLGMCSVDGGAAFPSGILAVRLAETKLSAPGALALDASQGIFIVGSTAATTDLGSGPVTPAGTRSGDAGGKTGSDVLVARLDEGSGRATWTRLFGDELDQLGSSAAANSQGQVAISGLFRGSMTFGPHTITNPTADNPEAFVAAVDASSGAGLWAMRPIVNGAALAVVADPSTSDFVVCGGAAEHAATGLAPAVTSADESEIVVGRLNARTGAVVWGRQISAPGLQTCDRLAADGAGHLFLAGTLSSLRGDAPDGGTVGDVDFGAGVHVDLPAAPAGGSSTVIWVARLDAATGAVQAAIRFFAPQGGLQTVQRVACDGQGNLLVAGALRNLGIVGEFNLSAGGVQSAFAAKFDTTLVPLWARRWGGSGAAQASVIASEAAGTLLVAGSYTRSLELDDVGIALGQSARTSAFIARLDAETGEVLSARGYGGAGVSQASYGLAVGSSGEIWLAGVFTGALQLGAPAEVLTTGEVQTGFVSRIAP